MLLGLKLCDPVPLKISEPSPVILPVEVTSPATFIACNESIVAVPLFVKFSSMIMSAVKPSEPLEIVRFL